MIVSSYLVSLSLILDSAAYVGFDYIFEMNGLCFKSSTVIMFWMLASYSTLTPQELKNGGVTDWYQRNWWKGENRKGREWTWTEVSLGEL